MKKAENKKDNFAKRVTYLDLLRVIAIFSMMMLHVCAAQFDKIEIASFSWQVLNVYDGIVRFCVPVFVMISGVFFLNPQKEYTLRKIIKNNVLRMVTAYLFWSFCYAVAMSVFEVRAINMGLFKSIVENTICGRYHLWFINMMVGIYLIVPFLRKIVSDKKLLEYFILLSFVICYVGNMLGTIPVIGPLVDTVIGKSNFGFAIGYTGFFMSGYYFYTYEVSQKVEKIIYLLGLVSVLITIIGTSVLSMRENTYVGVLYNYLLPTICFQAWAVFIFFQKRISRICFSEKADSAIGKLSALSFGMYLVHDFVNILYKFFGITTTSFNTVFSVPVLTIGVFIISLAIIWILHKIPVVNKYLI